MGIDVVVTHAAALDIAKASLVACARTPDGQGGWRLERQLFGTTSGQLRELADWLGARNVTRVAMESTGAYWKPAFYLLETQMECWLLNPQHVKAVSGRKTDVKDAEWLCELTAHGLVTASFVPPPPVRRLRDLTRRRSVLLADRSREKQRLEKLLEDAGVKLSCVASDIFGVSGRAMLTALINGERDPRALAELARGRMRSKINALAEALTGWFDEHHAFLASMILNHIDTIDAMIDQLDQRLSTLTAPMRSQIDLLRTIPGVDTRTAQVIIAEIGPDTRAWPTAAHLASWAGLCPGNNKTGGKAKPTATRPGNRWLKAALGTAALAAIRTKGGYHHALHRRIARRRGPKRALGAIAHSLLTATWHILATGTTYRDPDTTHLTGHPNPDHRRDHHVRQLQRLGYQVTLHQPTPVAPS